MFDIGTRDCMGTIGNKIVFSKYWKDRAFPGKYSFSQNPFTFNYKMASKVKVGIDKMVNEIKKRKLGSD